jgi:hypothetical protein
MIGNVSKSKNMHLVIKRERPRHQDHGLLPPHCPRHLRNPLAQTKPKGIKLTFMVSDLDAAIG